MKFSQVGTVPDAPRQGGPPWLLIAGIVAVVTLAAFVLYPSPSSVPEPFSDSARNETAAPDEPTPRAEAPMVPTRPASPKPPPGAPLPALPVVPNLVPRPPEVIRGAYAFIANNPNIAEYIHASVGVRPPVTLLTPTASSSHETPMAACESGTRTGWRASSALISHISHSSYTRLVLQCGISERRLKRSTPTRPVRRQPQRHRPIPISRCGGFKRRRGWLIHAV